MFVLELCRLTDTETDNQGFLKTETDTDVGIDTTEKNENRRKITEKTVFSVFVQVLQSIANSCSSFAKSLLPN